MNIYKKQNKYMVEKKTLRFHQKSQKSIKIY